MKTQTIYLALFILVLSFILPLDDVVTQQILTFQRPPFQVGNLNDIVFIGQDSGWAIGYDGFNEKAVIIHTVNGGGLWELQEIPEVGNLNAIYMVAHNVGYAVGEERLGWSWKIVILKTTNGGQQWERQQIPEIEGKLHDAFFTSADQGVVVGIDYNNVRTLILRTTNGVDWEQLNHPFQSGALNAVHFPDNLHGWAAGRASDPNAEKLPVFKTTDGGATWTEVITPVSNGVFLDVFFTTPDSGFVVGESDYNGVVLRTIDGGETWDETLFIPNQLPKSTSEDTFNSEIMFNAQVISSIYLLNNVGILTSQGYQGDSYFFSIFFKTNDAGVNWMSYGANLSYADLSKAYISPVGDLFTTGSASGDYPKYPYNPIIGKGDAPWKNELRAIGIDPNKVTLASGETQKFTAKGEDPYGNPVDMKNPVFELDGGGTFDQNGSEGTFTAEEPGDWTLTCTDQNTGIVGEASIHIKSPDSVRVWVDENGVLHIKLWANANVKIGVDENGNVLVNGQPVGDPPVKAEDLKGINVEGGDGDNVIDLRDVKMEDFPSIEDGKIFMDGGDGDDTMYGSEFGDFMFGGPGNDKMYGGDGDDTMLGGDGDDYMDGGPGDDHLDGGDGDDYLEGGTGNDVLVSKPGSTNVLSDEGGNDTVDFSPANFGITIDLDLQHTDQVVDTAGNIIRLEGEFENFTGSDFDDVVYLYPLDVPRRIDGGGHVQGDTIYIDAKGLSVTQTDSTLTVEGYAPITHYNYASVNIIHRVLEWIKVTPSEVTLQLGEEVQFIAAGFDGSNSNMPVTPIWSTTGGAIDSSGLYTATEIGEFTVTASDDGSSITGIAAVRVITTSVERIGDMPKEFTLSQNYPNPFNPETIIEYSVKEACHVRLEVFNVVGRNVLTLVNSFQQPGVYRVSFDAAGLSTGIYFYRIRMNDYTSVKKMVLLQ